VIRKFANKLLNDIHEGRTAPVRAVRGLRIKDILQTLDAAKEIKELNLPDFDLRRLNKGRFRGFWSIRVMGAERIVFRFKDGEIHDVDRIILPLPKSRGGFDRWLANAHS
jgi:plasmid maintenance system killer protein